MQPIKSRHGISLDAILQDFLKKNPSQQHRKSRRHKITYLIPNNSQRCKLGIPEFYVSINFSLEQRTLGQSQERPFRLLDTVIRVGIIKPVIPITEICEWYC